MPFLENVKYWARRKDLPLLQFIKYGMCGGLATLADFTVFYTLAIFVLPALNPDDEVVRLLGLQVSELTDTVRTFRFTVNRILSFMIANMVAYITNVIFVFESGRHSRLKELLLFYCVSGVAFGIGLALAASLIQFFGISTTLANLSNIVSAVLINYALRRFYIFKG